jgi:hypothetical protein
LRGILTGVPVEADGHAHPEARMRASTDGC